MWLGAGCIVLPTRPSSGTLTLPLGSPSEHRIVGRRRRGSGAFESKPWLVRITSVPLGVRPPAEIISGELIVRRSDPTKVTSAHVRQGPYGNLVRCLDEGEQLELDQIGFLHFTIPPM